MREVNWTDRPANRMRDWLRGQRASARHLNEVVEAANREINAFAGPRQVTPPQPPAFTPVWRFRLVSVHGDYLECLPLDVDGEPGDNVETVTIAKPYMLRRTPFDDVDRNGITYTYASDIEREADDGTNTETQVIVPSYVGEVGAYAGDELWATTGIVGGTGVSVGEGEEEQAVIWLDINLDGRAWAKESA